MKLYVDVNGDRHYLVTDDGEAVYLDELQEEGRDTELLEQAIKEASRRRLKKKAIHITNPTKTEPFNSD